MNFEDLTRTFPLHGLTEMTPAQKSLFTVLQLPLRF